MPVLRIVLTFIFFLSIAGKKHVFDFFLLYILKKQAHEFLDYELSICS